MKLKISKKEAIWIAEKSGNSLAKEMVECGQNFSISTTDCRNIHLTIDLETIKITVK